MPLPWWTSKSTMAKRRTRPWSKAHWAPHGHVVEEAETHRLPRFGVVAGWPDGREPGVEFSLKEKFDHSNDAPCRQQRHVRGGSARIGVPVQGMERLISCPLDGGYVVSGVDPENGFFGCGGGRHLHHAAECRVSGQSPGDGSKPVRTFGMFRWNLVFEEDGIQHQTVAHQTPLASAPHKILCSCVWIRTGRPSSRIQRASCPASMRFHSGENRTRCLRLSSSSRVFRLAHW